MARKSIMIGGYPHSAEMAAANLALKQESGIGLRAWILQWKDEHPRGTVEDLAAALGRHRGTAYDWLKSLRIDLGGPEFIDLDAERQRQALAEDDATVAELEARTGSDG